MCLGLTLSANTFVEKLVETVAACFAVHRLLQAVWMHAGSAKACWTQASPPRSDMSMHFCLPENIVGLPVRLCVHLKFSVRSSWFPVSTVFFNVVGQGAGIPLPLATPCLIRCSTSLDFFGFTLV